MQEIIDVYFSIYKLDDSVRLEALVIEDDTVQDIYHNTCTGPLSWSGEGHSGLQEIFLIVIVCLVMLLYAIKGG